jgi:hypothetical protein
LDLENNKNMANIIESLSEKKDIVVVVVFFFFVERIYKGKNESYGLECWMKRLIIPNFMLLLRGGCTLYI